jgi:hypothetical protein
MAVRIFQHPAAARSLRQHTAPIQPSNNPYIRNLTALNAQNALMALMALIAPFWTRLVTSTEKFLCN